MMNEVNQQVVNMSAKVTVEVNYVIESKVCHLINLTRKGWVRVQVFTPIKQKLTCSWLSLDSGVASTWLE